jgi:hypothetical protein
MQPAISACDQKKPARRFDARRTAFIAGEGRPMSPQQARHPPRPQDAADLKSSGICRRRDAALENFRPGV